MAAKTIPASIKRDHMKPVLTIHCEGDQHKSVYRFYILYPGDVFERFGGSSRGLLVRKTSSLIVRYSTSGHTQDTEYNLENDSAWRIIGQMINGIEGFKVTATPGETENGND